MAAKISMNGTDFYVPSPYTDMYAQQYSTLLKLLREGSVTPDMLRNVIKDYYSHRCDKYIVQNSIPTKMSLFLESGIVEIGYIDHLTVEKVIADYETEKMIEKILEE